jgi:hypothetical protein
MKGNSKRNLQWDVCYCHDTKLNAFTCGNIICT